MSGRDKSRGIDLLIAVLAISLMVAIGAATLGSTNVLLYLWVAFVVVLILSALAVQLPKWRTERYAEFNDWRPLSSSDGRTEWYIYRNRGKLTVVQAKTTGGYLLHIHFADAKPMVFRTPLHAMQFGDYLVSSMRGAGRYIDEDDVVSCRAEWERLQSIRRT